MSAYNIAVVFSEEKKFSGYPLKFDGLNLIRFNSLSQLLDSSAVNIDVVGILGSDEKNEALIVCQAIRENESLKNVPIIVAVPDGESVDAIALFEAGCSDILSVKMDQKEITHRVTKLVVNKIAEDMLKKSADDARKVVLNVMTESSNLGNTVHFLVDSNFCDNVDELGMLLFQVLKIYNIQCSVQMRSIYGVKNMEATGIEKELESRLLSELHTRGRFVEFGKRCVVNFGQVSLLIKNMPLEDKEHCTLIKDSVSSLVQGVDSRLKALDAQRALEVERDVMNKLIGRLREVMEDVDGRYQQVMRNSADLVEDMSSRMDESVLFLDLTQEQESTIEKIMGDGVTGINKLFSEGVNIDGAFRALVNQVSSVFDMSDGQPSAKQLLEFAKKM